MSENIRQLKDDLALFYPITCVEAVVGGNLGAGTIPKEIDLTSYLTNNFKATGNFIILNLYKGATDGTYMMRINVEVSRNESYSINAISPNVIAENIPLKYRPAMNVVLKTITDDTTCKATVVLQSDGKIVLYCVPDRIISRNEDTIVDTPTLSMNQVSAIGITCKSA